MTLINKYYKVLDYGFIALKDYMGSDEDIEQAARVSYQSGTRKVSDTRQLLRYLLSHKHTSPFEQAECKFHIRLPMYVMRQLVRHRTGSLNEVSGRFSILEDEFHKIQPNEWRLQSEKNKQGSSKCLNSQDLSESQQHFHHYCYKIYQDRLYAGVARELARIDLPLSTYTEIFWKIDLHNLLHFLNLRCQSNAQKEIRNYANIIAGIVKQLFPVTFEAWEDYVFYSKTLSYQQREVLAYIYDEVVENTDEFLSYAKYLGITNREIADLFDNLTPPEKYNFPLDNATKDINNDPIVWE